MDWEPVIGLEVHLQLNTRSKLFSPAANQFGGAANTQSCVIDAGLPGVLPVLNGAVALLVVKFGLAVNACINQRSVFARKNYFYPDLPKGYQISQYEQPILEHGELPIHTASGRKRIQITRAHIEEDAGKSLHLADLGVSGIDLNRAGTPLLEIVTEPDLSSPAEAVAYLRELHRLVRYLGISEGNMEEGAFRCDANISLRPQGAKTLGIRSEIKNINSFRFVEQALHHEIKRQAGILDSGGEVVQETRLFNPDQGVTRTMRGKEDAHDYRYFPDPDLPPLLVSDAIIEEARASMPELPVAKQQRFATEYGLNEADIEQLVDAQFLADYFEETVKGCGDGRVAANWILGDLTALIRRNNLTFPPEKIPAENLAMLIKAIDSKRISGKIGKKVLAKMLQTGEAADAIIAAEGLSQISDSTALSTLVTEILHHHPQQVEQYLQGETKVLGYLIGQAMQRTAGKANPKLLSDLFRQALAKE